MDTTSRLEASLPREAAVPAVEAVLASLRQVAASAHQVAPDEANALWQVEAHFATESGETWTVTVYLRATDQEAFDTHLSLGWLSDVDQAAVRDSVAAVGVVCELGEEPLHGFHLQIRVLARLAPNALAVLDWSAFQARPGLWLTEAASTEVPPHPHDLWTIHAVHDEDSDQVWLHTHGLHRCGLYELDALPVPREDVGLIGQLINSAAKLWLDHGMPEPDEVFPAGMDLDLVWVPVERALQLGGELSLGGEEDRDPVHAERRATLFRPGEAAYERLDVLLPVLRDHPVLYVSSFETERATALAIERLDRLRRILDLGRGVFGCVMKLAFPTDHGEADGREHIWFEVHALREGEVDATCLNRPHDVGALREGLRGTFPLALLSDWALLSPFGQLGPDRIALAEALVEDPRRLAQLLGGSAEA